MGPEQGHRLCFTVVDYLELNIYVFNAARYYQQQFFRRSILTVLLNYFSLAESPCKRPETPPKTKKVGISQIASVVAEVYGSRLVAGPGVEQPTIPLQQKLLICTVLLMTKECNTKEVVLGKVGFEFQVSFFHMLTNRTGISCVISYPSTCRYTISWQVS